MDHLDNKTMIEILPEFRYSLGDMRQHLYYYMRTLNKFDSYHDFDINEKNSYLQGCFKLPEKDVVKKLLRPPSPKYFSLLKKKISNSEKPFVIIPILMKNKFACYSDNEIQTNISKHLGFALYNRNTHELERIDIKKYHLKHFSIKPLYKTLKFDMLKHIREIDPACQFVQEHDVTPVLFQQLRDTIARNIYPMFIITYLQTRNAYPNLKSAEILEKIDSFDRSKFVKYWKHYVKFCKKYYKFDRCVQKNLVDNFETGRCIDVNNKMFFESRWNKPVQDCKSNMKFSNILKKCVNPKHDEEVNIFLDKLLTIQVNRHNKFTGLGGPNKAVPIIQYIINKHKNALVLFPKNIEKNRITHTKIGFSWKYNKDLNKLELKIPKKFDEMWQNGLNDDNITFLLILCHIQSMEGGNHANVLIYDKRNGEIERFDALGAELHPLYNIDEFDEKVQSFLIHGGYIENTKKYFTPFDYCPRLGLYQSKEMDEIGFDDDHGNCAIWRAFYIDMRLANPTMSRVHLIKYSLKQIENYGSFQKFIKSYQHYLTMAIEK